MPKFEGANCVFPSFLISKKNLCCWTALISPLKSDSNEIPQHLFDWRNKKNIKMVTHQILADLELYKINHEHLTTVTISHYAHYEHI